MAASLPSLSKFEEAAPEIIERIALYAVAFTPLGPPSVLCTLCRLSHRFNAVLGKNSHLYASIFYLKFDHTALVRRLSQRWYTTRCLTIELKKRFHAMKRIRNGIPTLDDLWTAYLMLLENDGMNEGQLLSWADIEGCLVSISTGLGSTLWGDMEGASLMSWLLWLTSSRDSLRREDQTVRTTIMHRLHPFIVAGYQYPNIFAPDTRFHLPLCPHSDPPPVHPSLSAPCLTKIQHYGHDMHLAVPLISSAASLAFVSRIETLCDSHGLPEITRRLPRNREEANAVGHRGATHEDFVEFQYHTRTRMPARRSVCTDYQPCDGEADEDEDQNSRNYDADWSRLVACYDPWLDDSPLRGTVYTLGALSGSWAGRIQQPDHNRFLQGLVDAPTRHNVPLTHQPVYMRLQEHHCLHPNHPLPISVDENSVDDILNAWLPRGLDLRHMEDAIEVYDQTSGSYIRYETYSPSGQAPYKQSATERAAQSWVDDDSAVSDRDRDGEEGVGSDTDGLAELLEPVYMDDDDEYEDTVVHRPSGVTDILITGKTEERHGAAWGHYTIVGRVRPWDGLIVLLRMPVDSLQALSGHWLFEGYLHDQNLVGRWKESHALVNHLRYEGSFVMGKIDD